MPGQHIIGYARVSTPGQSLDLQHDALADAGALRIFTDIASGSTSRRPAWDECLDYLQPGNVLTVWKLDRIGRSTAELARIVAELGERGVHFKSLTESFMDTTTADGRLIFHIFASLAEHERTRLVERTRAGLEAARARGNIGGRPSTVTAEQVSQARRMQQDGLTIVSAARILGVGRMSLTRAMNRRGAADDDGRDGQLAGAR